MPKGVSCIDARTRAWVRKRRPFMIHKEPVEMVLDIAIGRRLLNVREAAQYLSSKWTLSTRKPGCGRSLRQGWSSVAVRCESARALHRAAHNRNH